MAKPNTYVQLKAAQKQIAELSYRLEMMKGFTLQQSLDMAQIALHEKLGFGPERNAKFAAAFWETFQEYAALCVGDGADDPEIVYTKDVVDRMLREACGDDILPFDERYSPEHLYRRDRDLEGKLRAEG